MVPANPGETERGESPCAAVSPRGKLVPVAAGVAGGTRVRARRAGIRGAGARLSWTRLHHLSIFPQGPCLSKLDVKQTDSSAPRYRQSYGGTHPGRRRHRVQLAAPQRTQADDQAEGGCHLGNTVAAQCDTARATDVAAASQVSQYVTNHRHLDPPVSGDQPATRYLVAASVPTRRKRARDLWPSSPGRAEPGSLQSGGHDHR